MIFPDVPLPRLLDNNGNAVGIIRPIQESVNLTIVPLSYATMELPVGESLQARSFVELFTSIGSVGVFRVRSPRDAYGDDTTTAELEHAIVEVGDYLVRESINESLGASAAMQRVFAHYRGSHWQLGNISALGTDEIDLAVNHERVLDAMLMILSKRPDCMMTFDFSSHPWTVGIALKGASVTAEGRLGRNVNSAKVIYDDTDLCTRVYYPIDVVNQSTGETEEEWHSIDADTLSVYGLSERACYDSADETPEEIEATAREFLAKYKKPLISVQINAEAFSEITGEELDSFTIGKLFRLVLEDYGVTTEKHITALSWESVYDSPTDVLINLEDEEADVASLFHDVDANGGTVNSNNRFVQEMRSKNYRTKFEQTDRYFDLLAQHVDDVGEILSQAGLYIDPDTGVLVYADDFEQNLGSKLEVQAAQIGMVVGTYQGSNYIKAGEIALAINASTGQSEAKIDADHVYIGTSKSTTVINGKANISDLNAATARITTLESDAITTNNMSSQNLNVASLTSNRGTVSAYTGSFTQLNVGGDAASYKSTTVVTAVYRTLSATKAFAMENGSTWYSAVVTQVTSDTATLHYLGSAPT